MARMPDESNVTKQELGIYNGVSFTIVTKLLAEGAKSYQLDSKPLDDEKLLANKKFEYSGELLIIDSVFSGSGRDKECDFATNVIAQFFEQVIVPYRLIRTTSKSSVIELASSIDSTRQYTVLFLSGDTSISEFVNNLPLNHDCISVLPFPMGTGNAWASSLKLMDPAVIFSQFVNGKLSCNDFPLYKATFDDGYVLKFFIILSLGFHANLLHLCEEDEYQKMGIERFRVASQRILREYKLESRVSIPNILEGSFSYFALINTTNLEPTYMPSPNSDPLKSQLHVLAYQSSLDRVEFQKRVLMGYSNTKHSNILQNGTFYKPLPFCFNVEVLDAPSQKSNFEVCCDGQLLNLLELKGNNSPPSTIRIETCTEPSLRVLHSL
ncbi:hypothetical protein KDRO_B00290 [Kluyveromyces lactis]|nr:hypothetical protein KDRO_B00290 [Kluyveromyces lactis]